MLTWLEKNTKKHSLLLQDSSSESETEGTTKGEGVANEFFGSFKIKYIKKDVGFRISCLKAYREDNTMQNLARAVLDCSMDDQKRFEFLFETEGNLKLI